MLSLSLYSPGEILLGVAGRAKRRRLDLGLTQQDLAERAQVSLGTLKLFERTGRASLETVVLVAFALGAEEQFTGLFPEMPPQSIEDVVGRPKRQRGRRR